MNTDKSYMVDVNILQDRALDQHQVYVNNTAKLHQLEKEINELCDDVKKLKTMNVERQSRIERLTCHNDELKKVVAKENTLSEIVIKQKTELEDQIASVKSNFLKELEEHEKLIAKSSARFSSAPLEYGFTKMSAQADTLRMKAMELTSKTQKTIKEQQEELLKQLAEIELERKEFLKIHSNLNEKSIEKYTKSLGSLKDQITSDSKALESIKEKLTMEVEKRASLM